MIVPGGSVVRKNTAWRWNCGRHFLALRDVARLVLDVHFLVAAGPGIVILCLHGRPDQAGGRQQCGQPQKTPHFGSLLSLFESRSRKSRQNCGAPTTPCGKNSLADAPFLGCCPKGQWRPAQGGLRPRSAVTNDCRQRSAGAVAVGCRALARHPADRADHRPPSSVGGISWPWLAPAARVMLSSISVPPRSLAPACRQTRAPSGPILTQEVWMLAISGMQHQPRDRVHQHRLAEGRAATRAALADRSALPYGRTATARIR